MYQVFKRISDIALSSICLIILSPLLIPITIGLRLTGEGYIFYKQERVGYKNRRFFILKFATMLKDSPNMAGGVITTKKDPRITPMGGFLRKSKINELPQLVNILLGDMSFVGPRPSLPDLKEKFNEDGRMRVTVKPGLTNLAAVNGSIFLSWPERWVYDRIYVERQSFIMDMTIMLKTAVVVIMGENFYHKKTIDEVQASDGK